VNILICDDLNPEGIEDRVNQAQAALGAEWNITSLTGEALGTAIQSLFDDVNKLLDPNDGTQDVTTEFDGNSLILLDFGLTALKNLGVRLTAEHLAGYIRAFSTTPYVVSLNKLPNVDFDLKYLLGDFDTRADLALNTDHLNEPGLWTGEPAQGSFCPWYWPTLQKAANRRTEQIEFVKENLEQSILEAIAFPDEVVSHLSRQAIAFLSPKAEEAADSAKDIRKTTFWHHFRSSDRSLPLDDRKALIEKFGGDLFAEECPDNDLLRTIVARVVAAELEFWFRRDINGPQKVLIDVPHLQSHLRFRTDEGAHDLNVWSRTAADRQEPFGLDLALYQAFPEGTKFQQCWVDWPAFWLPLLQSIEQVEAMTQQAGKRPDFVFCEDTRRFVQRANATRFVSELTKGIDVRFVQVIEGKEYSPRSLFAR
jgi:hypothetical protein